MMHENERVSTSKFLSLVLRHRPEVIGLTLDGEGWLEIDELVHAAREQGRSISIELVYEVVATNEKRRFELSDDGLRIRASQGHSIRGIELNLSEASPPETLYHGTVAAFMDSILKVGLEKRSRNHVHLSMDEETARKVGSRRGKPVVLRVAARAMEEQGHRFYLSKNGVWLTEAVPPMFIEFPTTD